MLGLKTAASVFLQYWLAAAMVWNSIATTWLAATKLSGFALQLGPPVLKNIKVRLNVVKRATSHCKRQRAPLFWSSSEQSPAGNQDQF